VEGWVSLFVALGSSLARLGIAVLVGVGSCVSASVEVGVEVGRGSLVGGGPSVGVTGVGGVLMLSV
jgi:hypothetical protein